MVSYFYLVSGCIYGFNNDSLYSSGWILPNNDKIQDCLLRLLSQFYTFTFEDWREELDMQRSFVSYTFRKQSRRMQLNKDEDLCSNFEGFVPRINSIKSQ